MASESTFWKYLKRRMEPVGWLPRRIECNYPAGILDIYYRLPGLPPFSGRWYRGWMELKYLPEYPKNKDLLIKIKHFTKEQKLSMKEEKSTGNVAWLFLKIAQDYFLIQDSLAINLEKYSYNELVYSADYFANRIVDHNQIHNIMVKEHERRQV